MLSAADNRVHEKGENWCIKIMRICLYAHLDRHTCSSVTIIHYIPRHVKSNKLAIYQRLMGFIAWFILGFFSYKKKLFFCKSFLIILLFS